MKFIRTELNKIEISYDNNADFELSIDGLLMHKSDVDELYELLKEVKENELLHSVSKSFTKKQVDDAYQKGYNDAMKGSEYEM